MERELIDQAVIAAGCGLSTFALFGKRGVAPAVLSFTLAWMYGTTALAVAAGVLALFALASCFNRDPAPTEGDAPAVSEIIDAEFTVNEVK